MLGQRALLGTATPELASRPLAMPETRARRPAVRVLGSLCTLRHSDGHGVC